MFDLEQYLKDIAHRLPWITEPDKQIKTVAGLDAAASVMQYYEGNAYPLVLIEDMVDGSINFEDGFLDTQVKNIWVMGKPQEFESAAERKAVMALCHTCQIDILKLLLNGSPENRFSYKRVHYYPMTNVGLCFGWVFSLAFLTDFDLT